MSKALLGLTLLLGGFDAFYALRVCRLAHRLAMVQHAAGPQGLSNKTHSGAKFGTRTLAAPEVTTRSGREARMKVEDLLQVNLVSRLESEAPALH